MVCFASTVCHMYSNLIRSQSFNQINFYSKNIRTIISFIRSITLRDTSSRLRFKRFLGKTYLYLLLLVLVKLGQCIETVAVVQQNGTTEPNTMPRVIDFYYFPPSPPCRAVMLTAKAVGVNLNLKLLNITEGEQMNPDFVKLNPEHTVPTMVDNGIVAWESRAIMSYLVDMYAENDSLYPKDPQQRLLVDQRLYFDLGTLYNRILNYFVPVAFTGAKPDENQKIKVEEALESLNKYLENYEWVAGFGMTIADISIIVSVSTAEAVGINISKFSNVSDWYARGKKAMASFGYEEINQTGANTLGGVFRSKLC